MSSTGLKSLAGLTRARHRGNVAPSNSQSLEKPLARRFVLLKTQLECPASLGPNNSHFTAISINNESGSGRLTKNEGRLHDGDWTKTTEGPLLHEERAFPAEACPGSRSDGI